MYQRVTCIDIGLYVIDRCDVMALTHDIWETKVIQKGLSFSGVFRVIK